MPNSAHRDRIRQSWQPQRLHGAPAQAWLLVRRATATLVALALVVWCAYIFIRIVRNPKTYVVYATATTYRAHGGLPVAYAFGDFNAFFRLQPAFAGETLKPPGSNPFDHGNVTKQLNAVVDAGVGKNDALIVYLTAHGVVRDGKAHLLSESIGTDGELETIPVAQLLDDLARVPAGAKLLLLDAGRKNYVPWPEVDVQAFAEALEREVKSHTGSDETLWVLTANDSWEHSHVAPSLRQSVFGYFVSKGLAGRADFDADGSVEFPEFVQYVQGNVSKWSDEVSDGREKQSPRLFPRDTAARVDSPVLLYTQRLPVEVASTSRSLDVAADMKMAMEAGNARERPGSTTEAVSAEETGDAVADEARRNAINHAAQARQKLDEAWAAVDELERSRGTTPGSVYAPATWRELLDQLLWIEAYLSVDWPVEERSHWDSQIAFLRQLSDSLAALIKGERGTVNKNVVEKLRSQTPLAPPKITDVSLALARQTNAHTGDWTAFLKDYDAALAQTDNNQASEGLMALFNRSTDQRGDLDQYYEFQPAVEAPAEYIGPMILARGLSERVASHLLCGDGWARETIERGDRIRFAAERAILDQTDPEWREIAKDSFSHAADLYRQAEEELALVHSAVNERNWLLSRIPDYVAIVSQSPKLTESFEEVVASVSLLDAAITKQDMSDLASIYEKVKEDRALLNEQLSDEVDSTLVLALLSTALPSGKAASMTELTQPALARKALRDGLSNLEKKQMSGFSESPSDKLEAKPQESATSNAIRHARVMLSLSPLMGIDADTADKMRTLLQNVETNGSALALLPINELLCPQIRRTPSSNARASLAPWLLLNISQQDNGKHGEIGYFTDLQRLSWCELLDWQRRRFEWALADAPLRQAPRLRDLVAKLNKHVKQIDPSRQVEQVTTASQKLSTSPSSMDLSEIDEMELEVRVESTEPGNQPLWIVAQFNPDHIKIPSDFVSQATLNDIVEDLPKKNLDPQANDFSRLLISQETKPTTILQSGQAFEQRFKVRRLESSADSTKLILKAIGDKGSVRHEITIRLPGSDDTPLFVSVEDVFREPTREGAVLYVLPNQSQDFPIKLSNLGDKQKQLVVSLWKATKAPPKQGFVFPVDALDQDEIDEIHHRFGLEKISADIQVELPAGERGRSVALRTRGAAPGPDLLLRPPPTPEGAAIEVPYGVLVKLQEVGSDGKFFETAKFRWFQITPLRPQSFLRPELRYDRVTRQLTLQIDSWLPEIIPETGIDTYLRIAADYERGKLNAKITRGSPPVSLGATLSPSVRGEVEVIVDLGRKDDEHYYPRAIVYKFDPALHAADIVEPISDAQVRITKPGSGSPVFSAHSDTVPVSFEVDVPAALTSDQNQSTQVEVGIGIRNDDTDFRTLILPADRKVVNLVEALLPDGRLRIRSQVNDFADVPVPTNGFFDRDVPLVARLLIGGKEAARSERLNITLDGTPPRVIVERNPGKNVSYVIAGEDLEVLIKPDADHRDPSGIKKVEVAIKSQTPKWEEAKPGPERWTATLPTKELAATEHYLLIRATDGVGNVTSPPKEERFQIRPKQSIAAAANGPPPVMANVVTGIVKNGNELIADASVSMQAQDGSQIGPVKTDGNGRFRFPAITPGNYTIRVAAVVRNQRRSKSATVTVISGPSRQPDVTMDFRN